MCFAVVDSESNDNWLWFMEKLQSLLCDARDIVFISDRNVGIKDAISKVFPRSYQGFCLYHLTNNLRYRLSGTNSVFKKNLISLFSLCAHAPTK